MSLGNPPPNTPQTLAPPSFIEFDINNPPTQVQSISPNYSSQLTFLSCEEFSLNHHHIKRIINNALSGAEKHLVSIEINDYLKKGLTFISQKEHGIRDPSNHLSHMGLSPPILDETHQDPPSSLIPPESQLLGSPNDEFSIFTDKFQSKFYEVFKTFTHGHPTQAKY
ncbi:hypothetical protein O181_068088 [Austropuccinia psidii MF-1]|uniref:Uncharacterized protein n=1 Tax=Austropuccinia psidii MF-1 TaxID=1389203 RepID=A0A9Q3EZV0_9BASI|nr:hypothetical protein [Austropuccinia psidii MF-1]